MTSPTANAAPTSTCTYCGKAIRRDSKGYWGARKRNDPHPWYCDASPDESKSHAPAAEDDAAPAPAAQPVRCLAGCGRTLRKPSPDGYGRVCRAKLRKLAAVMESALEPLSEAQRAKAIALINSGKVSQTSRPGTYSVPSSDGTTTYLVTTAYCPCKARVICYHVGAVRCVEAVRASSMRRAACGYPTQ